MNIPRRIKVEKVKIYQKVFYLISQKRGIRRLREVISMLERRECEVL